MRYLTKQWYHTMTDSGLGVCLEPDPRAAECSEEMYQTLRAECDWPEIRAIRFRDARILTQEKPVENAWWLYDEIHRSKRGFEIHALLWQDGLAELTVGCTAAELVWTMESS